MGIINLCYLADSYFMKCLILIVIDFKFTKV